MGMGKYDNAHRHKEEDPYLVIGRVGQYTLLTVVCVYLDEDTVRIISARKASKGEKNEYYSQNVIGRS